MCDCALYPCYIEMCGCALYPCYIEMCGCALYSCYIDIILCIFTIYHTILSHDYTHPFSHPTFCKIVQLSSHMSLNVIFAIINPHICLGGGGLLVQTWEIELYYA
jgi:hypothetical protein